MELEGRGGGCLGPPPRAPRRGVCGRREGEEGGARLLRVGVLSPLLVGVTGRRRQECREAMSLLRVEAFCLLRSVKREACTGVQGGE